MCDYIGERIVRRLNGKTVEGTIVNVHNDVYTVDYKGVYGELSFKQVIQFISPYSDCDGYLYAVRDRDWKNKVKIGYTQNTGDDPKKELISRYSTPFGKGQVEVLKIVPVYGNVREAERKMLMRFGLSRGTGEIVYGSPKSIIKHVHA